MCVNYQLSIVNYQLSLFQYVKEHRHQSHSTFDGANLQSDYPIEKTKKIRFCNRITKSDISP